MRAIILAGGLGTRLRPYTTVIPKPLVPIGDRPVLEHIIRSLARSGVDRIDLCVNHLGQLIWAYLANAELPPDLQLAFHWETEPLGTAGAVGAVTDLEGTFIVMNGDVLTTLDYRELVDFHLEREAALTIAMHGKRVEIDLGVIEAAGRPRPQLHREAQLPLPGQHRHLRLRRARAALSAGGTVPVPGARAAPPGRRASVSRPGRPMPSGSTSAPSASTSAPPPTSSDRPSAIAWSLWTCPRARCPWRSPRRTANESRASGD